MKAAVVHEFGAEDVLRYEETPDPVPGPGEVLVRVRAAAINRGDLGRRMGTYPSGVPLPFIIGWDIAGEILKLGEGASSPPPGTRVVARIPQGGYAELSVAPARQIVPLPDGVSYEQAASLPVAYLTSWFALKHQGELKAGESCLVQAAASGVGVAGIQIAKAMGAKPIFTTASTEAKLALGRRLGADVAINYTSEDFVQVVRRETGDRGVDVVL
ncbi:MAG: quinone oxidoreductase family protein [Dehalococcoidia bacterium]